jgi:Xaa-Pro aminopeptidase
MIKNVDEVNCVRMACAIADAAFADMKEAIRPGIRECELVGIGMNRLYALGCDECQEFVCASGRRTNPMHIDFTDKIVNAGDVLAIDVNGASWQGYKSCYYRAFVCGKSNSEIDETYEKSRSMMYESMKYIKAGVPPTDIMKGWPDSPKYWGYETWPEIAGYALAHGLGISLHEYPWVTYNVAPHPEVPVLEEGMVLAVETWVGNDAKTFGIRLEENIVVTKDGYELLTLWPIDKITECPF